MSLKVERGRTRARSQALQLLFQAEALDRSLEDVLEGDYLLTSGPLEDYAAELARGTYEHISVIDRVLESVSDNWHLDRMPGTDRNLLRIATFEMRFADEKLEDAIVINEAVEIAKAFGTDESSKFVNGVLGRVAELGDEAFAEDTPEAEPEMSAAESAEDGEA